MLAVGLPMIPAAAQNAVLPGSNPVMVAAVATVAFATANRVRCIAQLVQAVGTRRKFLSSHEKTAPYTVEIASSLKVPQIAAIAVSRVGSQHDDAMMQGVR